MKLSILETELAIMRKQIMAAFKEGVTVGRKKPTVAEELLWESSAAKRELRGRT